MSFITALTPRLVYHEIRNPARENRLGNQDLDTLGVQSHKVQHGERLERRQQSCRHLHSMTAPRVIKDLLVFPLLWERGDDVTVLQSSGTQRGDGGTCEGSASPDA